jgi:hypothetical protein
MWVSRNGYCVSRCARPLAIPVQGWGPEELALQDDQSRTRGIRTEVTADLNATAIAQ